MLNTAEAMGWSFAALVPVSKERQMQKGAGLAVREYLEAGAARSGLKDCCRGKIFVGYNLRYI